MHRLHPYPDVQVMFRRLLIATLIGLLAALAVALFRHAIQKLQIAADMHSKAVDFSLLCRYKIQPMGHAYTAHVVLL